MWRASKPAGVASAREQNPLLGFDTDHPEAHSPTMAQDGDISGRVTHGRKTMPQTIGHRGFKGAAPENTMAAFRAAVESGADAVETDVRLTRDGVVVLCHDENLQRCYGKKAKVGDLDWSDISELRTVREPHEPMPRLVELLKYLDEPGQENVWLMLDIKPHKDAEEVMRRTAEALGSVPSKRPWGQRVTPCCWNATYIKFCMQYLPDFPITHVGFSTSYARCLVDIPNISFSMLRHTLASPSGAKFLRDMKKRNIPVYVWTVNEESWMDWCIRKEVSGVITDEVDLFHDVCDRVGGGEEQAQGGMKKKKSATGQRQQKTNGLNSWALYRTVRFLGEMALIHVLITIFMAGQWLRHGSPRHRVRKALDG